MDIEQPSVSTTKYIVVTGGVLSGLGKGIASASMGHLLSSKLFTSFPGSAWECIVRGSASVRLSHAKMTQ